jgi:DNA-binding MltR family transcriptional regulator
MPKRFPLVDLERFFERFRSETDRACAVLARSLLEHTLARLFQAHFVADAAVRDILEGQSALATFSARIRVAEALGWLSPDEASDLHRIREIGNDFAHGLDHEMNFDEQSIRDRVNALTCPRLLLDYSHIGEPLKPSDVEDIRNRPRRRFETAVGLLWVLLDRRIDAARPPQQPKTLLTTLDDTVGPPR